jgi:GxxExxY protein
MTHHTRIGLAHEELTGEILSAFYLVYNELGYGFLESVYEAALTIALERSGLRVCRQAELQVWFQGQRVGKFRADLMVEDRVIVELKAARTLEASHIAQLLNALRATEIEVGLLLNFGPKAEFKRMAFANTRKQILHNPRSSAAQS